MACLGMQGIVFLVLTINSTQMNYFAAWNLCQILIPYSKEEHQTTSHCALVQQPET